MLDKMKQLMEMKRQMETIKRELDSTVIDVHAIEGIRVSINGSQKFRSIEIGEQYLNKENHKRLCEELVRSLNAAIDQSQKAAAQKMKDVTSLQLPGL
ncbi:MAG: YbaB/EbfC family nucleoid-associated protein [Candidatus Omnitrophota bacterium]